MGEDPPAPSATRGTCRHFFGSLSPRGRGRGEGDNARILTHRPTDAALDEILKTGIAPSALVMTPGCVENAALALRPHPSPRLPVPLSLSPGGRGQGEGAILQNDTVFCVVLGVDVGFIPALETGESLHDRMIRIRNRRSENAGPVA